MPVNGFCLRHYHTSEFLECPISLQNEVGVAFLMVKILDATFLDMGVHFSDDVAASSIHNKDLGERFCMQNDEFYFWTQGAAFLLKRENRDLATSCAQDILLFSVLAMATFEVNCIHVTPIQRLDCPTMDAWLKDMRLRIFPTCIGRRFPFTCGLHSYCCSLLVVMLSPKMDNNICLRSTLYKLDYFYPWMVRFRLSKLLLLCRWKQSSGRR